jgi:hypothetical protein
LDSSFCSVVGFGQTNGPRSVVVRLMTRPFSTVISSEVLGGHWHLPVPWQTQLDIITPAIKLASAVGIEPT